jgi:hypothetical protein
MPSSFAIATFSPLPRRAVVFANTDLPEEFGLRLTFQEVEGVEPEPLE